MKYIQFKNGILSARYDGAIHGDKIPDKAIQVSDQLFFKTIKENDGLWALVDGEIIKQPFSPQPPEQLQSRLNADARQYLANTDWYVVRFSETGVSIPDDIKTKRQEARDAII